MRSAGLQQTQRLMHLFRYCRVYLQNVHKLSTISALFSAFSLSDSISDSLSFPSSPLSYNLFPFPLFLIPSPLLLLYLYVNLRHVWGVTAVWRSTVGYRTPPPLSISASKESGSLCPSVPKEIMRCKWRVAPPPLTEEWGGLRDLFHSVFEGGARSILGGMLPRTARGECVLVYTSPFLCFSDVPLGSAVFLCTNWSNYKKSVCVCACVLSYICTQRRGAKKLGYSVFYFIPSASQFCCLSLLLPFASSVQQHEKWIRQCSLFDPLSQPVL